MKIDIERLQLALQDYDRALFGMIEVCNEARKTLASHIVKSLTIENELLELSSKRLAVSEILSDLTEKLLTSEENEITI